MERRKEGCPLSGIAIKKQPKGFLRKAQVCFHMVAVDEWKGNNKHPMHKEKKGRKEEREERKIEGRPL